MMKSITVEIENEQEFLERLEESMDFVSQSYLRKIAAMLCQKFKPEDPPVMIIALKSSWINSLHEELITFKIVNHEYNDGHEKITFRYSAD